MNTRGSPEPIVPELAPDLPSLLLGLVRAEPVSVGPSGRELETEMEALCLELSARHAGRRPADIPGLAPARELYRAFGIDPTRTRPSSEALLRRVLHGKPLPRILNAVDLSNLCSLRFLLPIGLYDAGKIRGRVSLRRGRSGEAYPGIGKEVVHLEGRAALADEEGPFGNPSSDSWRTSVGPGTRSLWMVIFAPGDFPRHLLETHVGFTREAMARHLAPRGGSLSTIGVLFP